MSAKFFYYLMFYKLYKLASLTRPKEEASLVSGFLIGFLIIQWSIYVLAAIGVKNYIPKYFFWAAFLLSAVANIFFVLRNRNYEKVIEEMETKKVPIFFHLVIYLLLTWTIVGIIFL
jgi:hypothetical protein